MRRLILTTIVALAIVFAIELAILAVAYDRAASVEQQKASILGRSYEVNLYDSLEITDSLQSVSASGN